MPPGVKSKPVMPSGPDRDSSRYRASPTTTGGSPRNALVKMTSARRPGKEHTARAVPSDRPARVAKAVADRLTPRERATIRQRPSVSQIAQIPEAGTDHQNSATQRLALSRLPITADVA